MRIANVLSEVSDGGLVAAGHQVLLQMPQSSGPQVETQPGMLCLAT